MSTDLARRTSDDICREINACSAKLAQAEKKVEDWKDTRRQFLQELKDRFPDIWLKEAKENAISAAQWPIAFSNCRSRKM